MTPSQNSWLKITLAVSLGLSCLVRGIPTSNSQDAIILNRRAPDPESLLKIRADVFGNEDVRLMERGDPPDIPEDDIPPGKAEDAVQLVERLFSKPGEEFNLSQAYWHGP